MKSILTKLGTLSKLQDSSILQKLASAPKPTLLQKLAQGGFEGGGNDPSKFDESVPPMQDQSQGQDPNSPVMTEQQKQQEGAPADEQFAAMPMEQQAPPVDPGIAAAQAFIGPEIMQAAMSGDPNATNIVGAAAGHIARVANQPQTAADPNAGYFDQGQQAPMPPPITSAEDDLANVIAPMPMETLQQVEGGGSQQGQPAAQY
jgi:hypothetical protein